MQLPTDEAAEPAAEKAGDLLPQPSVNGALLPQDVAGRVASPQDAVKESHCSTTVGPRMSSPQEHNLELRGRDTTVPINLTDPVDSVTPVSLATPNNSTAPVDSTVRINPPTTANSVMPVNSTTPINTSAPVDLPTPTKSTTPVNSVTPVRHGTASPAGDRSSSIDNVISTAGAFAGLFLGGMPSPKVSDISSRRLSTEGKVAMARGGHGTDVQKLTVDDLEVGASPAKNGKDGSGRLSASPGHSSKALSASPGESRRAHAQGFVVISNSVDGAADQFLF